MTRIDSESNVDLILKYLEKGKNVLALLPNMINTTFQQIKNESDENRFKNYLCALGLDSFTDRLKTKSHYNEEIWWEEIKVSKGRLFVTEDSFVSDAYFMKGYSQTEQNTISLNKLADAFSTQKTPHIHIIWENPVKTWVCHEPYTLQFIVKNMGTDIKETIIELVLSSVIKPLSTTVFTIPPLKSLESISLAMQVEFRNTGKLNNIIKTNILKQSTVEAITSTDLSQVEVIPSLRGLALKHAPQDNENLSYFLSVANSIKKTVDLTKIQELANVDTEAALNKLRKAAEKLIIRVMKINKVKNISTFFNNIRNIESQNLLSSRSVGYLHTIRVIGNLASHPQESQLNDNDVRIVAFAFAAVIEEFIERQYV